MIPDLRSAALSALVVLAAGAAAHGRQPGSALLSGLARELACAPASPLVPPAMSITVRAGREARRTLFGTGEPVVIGGGSAHGVKAGEEYFVRRRVEDRFTEPEPGVYPISIQTVGLVQIAEVQNDFSVGVITYGCDGVLEGDYLEPFAPTPLPSEEVGTAPDFARPGRLILAAERRQIGGAGAFMVLDRGTDHGLRAGQRVTIFRRSVGGAGPVATVGTALVYVVQPETALVRIERSVDAVYVGDLVAIHR